MSAPTLFVGTFKPRFGKKKLVDNYLKSFRNSNLFDFAVETKPDNFMGFICAARHGIYITLKIKYFIYKIIIIN